MEKGERMGGRGRPRGSGRDRRSQHPRGQHALEMTFGRERDQGGRANRHGQRYGAWQGADMRAADRRVHEAVQEATLTRSLRRGRNFRVVRMHDVARHVPMRRCMQLTQRRQHRLPNEGQRQQRGPEPGSFRAAMAESGQHLAQYSGHGRTRNRRVELHRSKAGNRTLDHLPAWDDAGIVGMWDFAYSHRRSVEAGARFRSGGRDRFQQFEHSATNP